MSQELGNGLGGGFCLRISHEVAVKGLARIRVIQWLDLDWMVYFQDGSLKWLSMGGLGSLQHGGWLLPEQIFKDRSSDVCLDGTVQQLHPVLLIMSHSKVMWENMIEKY